MTFHVPYRKFPDGNGTYGYAVLLKLKLSSPANEAILTKSLECIVDSGATRCLFHADVADALGLDLRAGKLQMITGISGPEEIWIHEVTLHIPGGQQKITAGFKENLPVAGLLGMGGFFEFFTITFDSAMERSTFERVYRA